MSLLTDTSIRKLRITDKEKWVGKNRRERLLITNFNEKSLTPIGYDLRVGERYLKMYRKSKDFEKLEGNGELEISSNEIVAIRTEEFIGMPQNKQYSGIIVSKVSIAEEGFSHISTSVDADWKGELIITLKNYTARKIILKRGQPFCTLIIFKNEHPATKDCEKTPEKHEISLRDAWRRGGKIWRIKQMRKILFGLKILVPAVPLIWLLHKYFTIGVSGTDVVLFTAISTFLFFTLNRITK